MLNTFQQGPHPMLPRATHDEASRQEFTKALKGFVQSSLLPGLTPVFRNRVSRAFEREHGHAPADRREIRGAMIHDLYFQHYAATNRIAQELLWEATNLSVERELPDLIEKARSFSEATPATLDQASHHGVILPGADGLVVDLVQKAGPAQLIQVGATAWSLRSTK